MKKQIEIKKKFIKFLKDNDAFIPFVCNLAISTCKTYDVSNSPINKLTLTQYINKTLDQYQQFYGEELFIDAFNWRNSKEGRLYWSDLDDKWITLNK